MDAGRQKNQTMTTTHNNSTTTAGSLADLPGKRKTDRQHAGRLERTDPLSDVETHEQLRDRIASAKSWIRWTRKNPEGGIVKVDGSEIEVTDSDARKFRRLSADILAVHAPTRSLWLSRRDMALAQVVETYPALLDPNSREFAASQEFLQKWPELKRFPDYLLLIGDFLAGESARKLKAARSGLN